MSANEKLEAIKQLISLWKSGELSSYDFACAVENDILEDDEDDGQPSEAQEWADFDADC